MSPEEMIAVIKAHTEGKTIQCQRWSDSGNWGDTKHPGWNFATYNYRVKPGSPIELEVAMKGDTPEFILTRHSDNYEDDRVYYKHRGYEFRKFREVRDES